MGKLRLEAWSKMYRDAFCITPNSQLNGFRVPTFSCDTRSLFKLISIFQKMLDQIRCDSAMSLRQALI
jgi:hypothetical protein